MSSQRPDLYVDPPDPTYRPQLLDGVARADLTFESLVDCEANRFLLDAARLLASGDARREVYNPLYVYGSVGVGKTHLLSAIANATSNLHSVLVNCSDLEAELDWACQHRARAQLRQWLTSCDLLLLDDIQMCEEREELQRELFSVINLALRNRTGIVITSDVPPTQLRGIETRLLSRLDSGAIVVMQVGRREERAEILRRSLPGCDLPEQVLFHLATHVDDNIRRLKAAATQLLVRQQLRGCPVTVEDVDALLAGPKPASQAIRQTAEPDASGSGRLSSVAPAKGLAEEDTAAEAAALQPAGDQFRRMLETAETQEEQILALQIAVSQKLRQLRNAGADSDAIDKLENALASLRAGNAGAALRAMAARA